jgi:hypothetical protein
LRDSKAKNNWYDEQLREKYNQDGGTSQSRQGGHHFNVDVIRQTRRGSCYVETLLFNPAKGDRDSGSLLEPDGFT